MLNRKTITTVFAAAAIAALSVVDANAQFGSPADSRTEFTFTRAVEMPGVTLPPGTYVFRFADVPSGRQVMQVMTKDANKPMGLFLTIQAQRPEASKEAEVRFMETPSGTPAAIKTWWYPEMRTGREFIYPKSQARRLAQATNQTVLTTRDENVSNDQMRSADLGYVSPTGQETALTDEQLVDVATTTAPTSGGNAARAQADPNVRQEGTSAANSQGRTELPRTSSVLPLIGLLGFTSLLGGAALRFSRR
jgi:hypothetical protein